MKIHYPIVKLRPGRDKSLLRGHPWLFSGAIAKCEPEANPGDIVAIFSADENPLGLGFYNPRSDITIRLLTREISTHVDASYWRNRVHNACELRKKILPPNTNAFRLINSEGDFIPGLIVDQYDSVLVIIIGTAGVENFRSEILSVLIEEIQPDAIFERSQGKSRTREGLKDRIGICFGESVNNNLEILENGLRFEVDISSGQKSGFFLDQRPNREIAKSISPNATVLNCFSYTGAFSVYCAAGGAENIFSIESSSEANLLAERNLLRNGFSTEHHPVVQADVFSYLRETSNQFDLIILDPPAFAKSQKDIRTAARGYKDINWLAMRCYRKSGFLMTFSCSNFIHDILFEKIVMAAASDAGKNVQILKVLGPGSDHPTNLFHPEGKYLKGLLLKISSP